MSSKHDFEISEDVDGVLRELCEAYGLDHCLLSWRFERHVMIQGASPFRMSTSDFSNKASLKDGVEKVEFEIEFSHSNGNEIKWIRFHEHRSNKWYIVTQTSIQHVNGENECSLWLELPRGFRKEDMAAVQNFSKVKLCCEEWKDFLPAHPETALERAFLVFASEDVDWIKKQLVHQTANTARLTNTIAFKNIEVSALKNEVDSLKSKLEEKLAPKHESEKEKAILRGVISDLETKLTEKNDLLDALEPVPETPRRGTTNKKRRGSPLTPKSRGRKSTVSHAHTDPVVNGRGGHSPLLETPTRTTRSFFMADGSRWPAEV